MPSAVLGAALADGGRDLHVLVNAGVERKGAPDPDTGAWWLRVAVGRGGGEKAPKVKKQRLLAAPDAGDSLLYAALGLDAKGKQGLVVFTVTGANHYPSPGFSVIRGGKPRKDVYIVAEGVAEACDGNQRWGDYHTVRMDEEGNFYGSVEWIASNVGGVGGRRGGSAIGVADPASAAFVELAVCAGRWHATPALILLLELLAAHPATPPPPPSQPRHQKPCPSFGECQRCRQLA